MKPPLGEPGAARITHPAHAAPPQKARVNTSGPRHWGWHGWSRGG